MNVPTSATVLSAHRGGAVRGPDVPDAVRQQQERCVFGIQHAAATLLVDEASRRVLPGAIDAKHQREDYKSAC